MNKLASALTLVAACVLSAAAAHAQTPTVINHLPYVINTKGLYVLTNDLSSSQTSGNLILINANNVTIDFQGHFLSGPVGNTTQTTTGIYAYERSNVTIRNGTIAYCNYGVYLYGNPATTTNAVGGVVENMRVTYCYGIGIAVNYYLASRVTNCQVSKIGYNGATNVFGINGYGNGTLIQGNTVSNVTANTSYGIYAGGGYARQNVVTNAGYGVVGGKYQDNLTSGCGYPVYGGTDAGGNN